MKPLIFWLKDSITRPKGMMYYYLNSEFMEISVMMNDL